MNESGLFEHHHLRRVAALDLAPKLLAERAVVLYVVKRCFTHDRLAGRGEWVSEHVDPWRAEAPAERHRA